MSIPQRIPQTFYAEPDSVPSWEFVQKYIPAVWTAIGTGGSTYLNSWRHYLGGNGIDSPACFRRNGEWLEFMGLIDKNGGNFAAIEQVAQLPPEIRILTSTWVFKGLTDCVGATIPGTAQMSYNVATATLTFVGGAGASAGFGNPVTYVDLTSLRFPLYPLPA